MLCFWEKICSGASLHQPNIENVGIMTYIFLEMNLLNYVPYVPYVPYTPSVPMPLCLKTLRAYVP